MKGKAEVTTQQQEQNQVTDRIKAQVAVQIEMEQRAQRVVQMIQALLQQERCNVRPSVVLSPGNMEFSWDIIALPLTD